MITWAKDNDGTLRYATAAEFKGIPNWQTHEPACRAKGYFPLIGEAEPREGYNAVPATWHIEQRSETHKEPRQVIVEDWETDPETGERRKTGEHTEMQEMDITLDKSFIQVDTWEYTPIPEPEPPDTTDRDNAEKAIVGAIVALAIKYNALEDLASMQDITIPNLKALADSKGVPEEEYGALITMLTPYKWQLEAVTGQLWAECWEGIKSRWQQWMQEINQ